MVGGIRAECDSSEESNHERGGVVSYKTASDRPNVSGVRLRRGLSTLDGGEHEKHDERESVSAPFSGRRATFVSPVAARDVTFVSQRARVTVFTSGAERCCQSRTGLRDRGGVWSGSPRGPMLIPLSRHAL